jgi:hypothetical protein
VAEDANGHAMLRWGGRMTSPVVLLFDCGGIGVGKRCACGERDRHCCDRRYLPDGVHIDSFYFIPALPPPVPLTASAFFAPAQALI